MHANLKESVGWLALGLGMVVSVATTASAEGVLTEKQISLPLAQEAAIGAIEQCRKDGYKVAVTVVDRAGQIKVALRDDGTGPHTLDTSRRKAYTSLTFRQSTSEFAKRVSSIPAAANLKDINEVITLGGGLPILSGTEVIGAIGVGGAPGGDKDEACGQAGINRIAGKLTEK
jgi:uncharacterized protein GlcG (DUF336 family)